MENLKTQQHINRWTDDLLDAARNETDPVADNVINTIMSNGSESEMEANQLFEHLIKNDAPIPDGLPDVAKAYFSDTQALPTWADAQLIKKGETVFSQYGPELVMLLFCKSLPECYACRKGAQVLYLTGRLTEQRGDLGGFTRRIMETAQFIVDVMAPDGLSATGKGVRATQKVRLIHATIRYFIERSPQWQAEWGRPINQEDLAGTLMSFSIALIDGIKKIGIDLTPEMEAGYLHAWKVVGAILGLHPDLMPEGVEDGRALVASILRRQVAASEAGIELTKALTDYLDRLSPGNLLRGVPEFLIRYLVGNDIADTLGIHESASPLDELLSKLVFRFLGDLQKIEDHSAAIRKLSQSCSRFLLSGVVHTYNEVKGIHFDLPPSLRGSWKVEKLV